MKKEIKILNEELVFKVIHRCAINSCYSCNCSTVVIANEDKSQIAEFKGFKNPFGYGCKLTYGNIVISNIYDGMATLLEAKKVVQKIVKENSINKCFFLY